ncbi:MAG TPA: hypothetical protein VIU62_21250 [Chloroflexota bacterium]
MHSEWQSRLDFLLVLVAIVVMTLVIFKLLGPQVFALTQYLLARIGGFFSSINSLIGGALGTRTTP